MPTPIRYFCGWCCPPYITSGYHISPILYCYLKLKKKCTITATLIVYPLKVAESVWDYWDASVVDRHVCTHQDLVWVRIPVITDSRCELLALIWAQNKSLAMRWSIGTDQPAVLHARPQLVKTKSLTPRVRKHKKLPFWGGFAKAKAYPFRINSKTGKAIICSHPCYLVSYWYGLQNCYTTVI